jgi:KipI family sensor histidine kinase inhibitor
MTPARFAIVACGDDALRVLCGSGDVRHTIARQLRQDARWREIVPGKQDVSVTFDPHAEGMQVAHIRLIAALAKLDVAAQVATKTHVLEAKFGGSAGPDLERVAEDNGKTQVEIVGLIESSMLSVDLLGFTPGFAYLAGLDPSLHAERLTHPRAQVPSGSIGLITGQIGLYALEGPGGWPIVGRVQTPLFDKSSEDPFQLQPGDRVTLRGSLAP